MVTAAEALARDMEDLAGDAYNGLKWLKVHIIDTFANWCKSEFLQLGYAVAKGAEDIAHWASDLGHKIESGLDSLSSWVLTHVWQPLSDGLGSVESYIAGHVHGAVDMLEHPERLAAWLLAPLYHAGVALLEGSESLIANWLLGGIVNSLLWAADVLEEIFAKMV